MSDESFGKDARDINYIPNLQLVVTGTYCPSETEWYAMATSSTEDMIIHYSVGDTSAQKFTLGSHDTLHTFSHISGTG